MPVVEKSPVKTESGLTMQLQQPPLIPPQMQQQQQLQQDIKMGGNTRAYLHALTHTRTRAHAHNYTGP